MKITYKEVLRYLGYSGIAADERSSFMINDMIDQFSASVIPKNIFGIWDCQVDSFTVTLGGMTIQSQNLARHLTGCSRVVLLAATLGIEVDMLIRRLSMQDMGKAVIAQAVSAVMIETYCDKIAGKIAQKPEFSGLYPTTRFSPGYGDFDIVHQKDVLNILRGSSIGLSLTDGYMLIPTKSVTAVIGFSPEKCVEKRQVTEKCDKCDDTQCQFREAG